MRGFTLVELVLTMLIIGILAAVVGPRFFERQTFEERLFFDETVAAVRYARKLAVASGCQVQVALDAQGYRIRRAAGCTQGAFVEVRGPDAESPYANLEVPDGVSIQTQNFPVVFDSLGRPGAAARADIGRFGFQVVADTGLVL